MTRERRSFCSKPYRFRVFNGDFVRLQTEWSSFINPWSKKFEFIVGQHRIIEGPVNINVFEDCKQLSITVEDDNYNLVKKMEEDIHHLLSLPVSSSQDYSDSITDIQSKRRRKLAAQVSAIVDNYDINNDIHEKWSDKTSGVLIGEISPHRDDSDTSMEKTTPPQSSKEKRSHESIERFFASQTSSNNISTFSSTASCCQNQSNNSSGSDGSRSSSNPKNSSADSAFQSGTCDNRCDGTSAGGENSDNSGNATTNQKFVAFRSILTKEALAQHDHHVSQQANIHKLTCTGDRKDTSCKLKRCKYKHTESNVKQKRFEDIITDLSDIIDTTGTFNISTTPFTFGLPVILPTLCQSCHTVSSNSTSSNQQFILPMVCTMPIAFYRQVAADGNQMVNSKTASTSVKHRANTSGNKHSSTLQCTSSNNNVNNCKKNASEINSQETNKIHKRTMRDLVTRGPTSPDSSSFSSSSFLWSDNATTSYDKEIVDDDKQNQSRDRLNENSASNEQQSIEIDEEEEEEEQEDETEETATARDNNETASRNKCKKRVYPWLRDINFTKEIQFQYQINLNDTDDDYNDSGNAMKQSDIIRHQLRKEKITLIQARETDDYEFPTEDAASELLGGQVECEFQNKTN